MSARRSVRMSATLSGQLPRCSLHACGLKVAPAIASCVCRQHHRACGLPTARTGLRRGSHGQQRHHAPAVGGGCCCGALARAYVTDGRCMPCATQASDREYLELPTRCFVPGGHGAIDAQHDWYSVPCDEPGVLHGAESSGVPPASRLSGVGGWVGCGPAHAISVQKHSGWKVDSIPVKTRRGRRQCPWTRSGGPSLKPRSGKVQEWHAQQDMLAAPRWRVMASASVWAHRK